MVEAANDGRRVRVLLDSFGAAKMPGELVDRLQSSGVALRWFRPLSNLRIWRNDNRTHRKILVVDDRIGFSGGVGIAEEWSGNARNADEWRDTHFSLVGPAVRSLKTAFLDNWNEAGGWQLDDSKQDDMAFAGGIPVQIVRASSAIGWSVAATLLRSLVAVSERSLTLVTPYFVPDARLEELLSSAAERGVRVTLMIPGRHCDMRLPQLAGNTSIEAMLEAGIRIWRYQRTNLHAKVLMIDGHLSCIGSANLNHRSMGKDEECCAVFLCPTLTKSLERQFLKDCEHAELLELDRWRARGIGLRLKEKLARTLVDEL
jgi:cardiolipin synthase